MSLAADFARDGFVVVPGFADPATRAALALRAHAIVDAWDPAEACGVFRTQGRRADDYFLSSGEEIRCFLEEDAADEGGALRVPKALAVNKIGHALHDHDPVFAPFFRSDAVRDIVSHLGVARALLAQSMVIFKQPRIGGAVPWHQDAAYLRTEPMSVVGLWLALEDADLDNGCLWAIPGGHRGPQRERFRRDGAGGAVLDRLDDSPWEEDGAVALPVAAGTLIALHGRLPHRSDPNRTDHTRLATTLHVIDAAARWAPDNWLTRRTPMRGFQETA